MDIRLSCRLSAVAAMVTPGSRVVDVGTDHAWLPLWLIRHGVAKEALAMDVRPGPLSRAKDHIAAFDMQDHIRTRLSDGLSAYKPGEGDTLILAGMGGPLMERILREGGEASFSFREWILQPQSDVPHLRRLLSGAGLTADKEDMVLEEGKFYPVLHYSIPQESEKKSCMLRSLAEGNEADPADTPMFGSLLPADRHPVMKQFLERELAIRNRILDNLDRSRSEKGTARLNEIMEEKRQILDALSYYS